jgi:hypothetical protein
MVLELLLELNRRVKYQIYTRTSKSRTPFFLILLAAVLLIANLFTEIPSCIIFEINNELAFDTRSAAPTAKNYTKERVSIVLPQTLYVIYGLESSGTTFRAKTVAAALGLEPRLKGDTVESRDQRIHIQHLPLPLGLITPAKWGYETRFSKPLAIVPVYYPTGCRIRDFGRHAPREVLKGDDYGHNNSRGRARTSNTGGRGTPRKRPSNMHVNALDGSYGTPQGFERQVSRTSTATSAQQLGTGPSVIGRTPAGRRMLLPQKKH